MRSDTQVDCPFYYLILSLNQHLVEIFFDRHTHSSVEVAQT